MSELYLGDWDHYGKRDYLTKESAIIVIVENWLPTISRLMLLTAHGFAILAIWGRPIIVAGNYQTEKTVVI